MSRKSNFDAFGVQLEERSKDLAVMLPSHVTIERFRATAIAAVKQTPGLLDATPRTLFGALTKAAQDGLVPDGREGVINVYNTKVKAGKEFHWEKQAQWLPDVFRDAQARPRTGGDDRLGGDRVRERPVRPETRRPS